MHWGRGHDASEYFLEEKEQGTEQEKKNSIMELPNDWESYFSYVPVWKPSWFADPQQNERPRYNVPWSPPSLTYSLISDITTFVTRVCEPNPRVMWWASIHVQGCHEQSVDVHGCIVFLLGLGLGYAMYLGTMYLWWAAWESYTCSRFQTTWQNLIHTHS